MKALMICLGNICRSPMAEGIVRNKAQELGIDLELDSCGTSGFHDGEHPDPRAIRNLAQKGIDISNLRSRKFQLSDFKEFDFLFVMDDSNKQDILSLSDNEEDSKKVKLFLNEAFPGENLNVPDPYYGGDEGFQNVYQMLEQAAEAFLDKINYD